MLQQQAFVDKQKREDEERARKEIFNKALSGIGQRIAAGESPSQAMFQPLYALDPVMAQTVQSQFIQPTDPIKDLDRQIKEIELRKLQSNQPTQIEQLELQKRQVELDKAELERQLKEQQILEKQQAQSLKTQEQEQKKEQKLLASQNVVNQANDTLFLIDRIMNSEGFESAVGAKGPSSLFGIIDPLGGTEAANTTALIEQLKAKNFIAAVGDFKAAGGAGALSDAEGKKLSAALGNLSVDQTEREFKNTLNFVKMNLMRQVNAARGEMGLEPIKSSNFNDYLASVRQDYTNQFGQQQPQQPVLSQNNARQPTMTPEDQRALAWANANPTDPRAAQIKQRLGATNG